MTGSVDRDERLLRSAFCIIVLFMLAEAVGGLIANSLTLIADAAHMLLDASALGIAWFASRLSRRDANERMSYGYHRSQVLAALVNGLTLVFLIAWILFEAVSRLRAAEPMLPVPVLVIGILGLTVNIVVYRMLHGSQNLNVRSAALHVLGDLLGSVAAIAAAVLVLLFDWVYADPLLAVGIAAILSRGAWRVLRESGQILLQGAPSGLSVEEIRATLVARVTGLRDIHRVHIWSLTSDRPVLTLHGRLVDGTDQRTAMAHIKSVLRDSFGVDHSTVQLERDVCPDDRH
ncbi:MAG: cation diffusion facilitator family transporter [Gammaproteobacteria bacterium]|nr:cation diffusion facilitator family transporter [Gammaproteobacteria bacterium]